MDDADAGIRERAMVSSYITLAAAFFGLWGFHVARICHHYQSERAGAIVAEHQRHGDHRRTLREVDITVSTAVHDTTGGHGVIFRGVSLCMGLLFLKADYPQHEQFPGPKGGEGTLIFNTLRSFLLPLALVLVTFVPTSSTCSNSLVQLRRRLREPGYQLTADDRAIYLAHTAQTHIHMVAALTACFVAPLLDVVAVATALHAFFGRQGAPDNAVHWERVGGSSWASAAGLTVTLTRLLALSSALVCGVRFGKEAFTGSSLWRRNPMRVALPEAMLLRNAMWSYSLAGASIWFVDEAAWEAKHPLLQALSLAVAAACTSRAAFKAVQHLIFNGCMDTWLSPTRIRLKLDALVQKRARYMKASNASLEYELREWQAVEEACGQEEESSPWLKHASRRVNQWVTRQVTGDLV